jgi:hypothetical protein
MKVTVSGASLTWPQKCAACGDEATASATAKCNVGKGVIPLPGFVLVRSNVFAVSYPVCSRHRLAAAIFGRMSQRNMLNLGLGVLSVVLLLGFFGGVYRQLAGVPEKEDSMPLIYWFVLPAIYWLLFYVARKFTPVKVTDFKERSVSFVFSNEQYGEEFKKKNPVQKR